MAAASDTLDIAGARGALTEGRARELAAPVLVDGQHHYKRVRLSTWAFSVDSAAVFTEVIRQLPELESADISDIIAGRVEEEGLAVYRKLGEALSEKQLRELNLSDNAVGTKGLEACRPFLEKQHRLEKLYLCTCGISAEAARTLADLLLFRTPTLLRVLHFHSNMAGDGGAVAIGDIVQASPKLANFRFTSCRAQREGSVALAKALAACPALLVLDLSDNTFGVAGAVHLGKTLRVMHCLRELDVSDIMLKDKGMKAVASGIVRGCRDTLEVLNVAGNDLTSAGAVHVARLLRRLPLLRVLDASTNEFGKAGAAVLGRGLTARARMGAARHGGPDDGCDGGDSDPLQELCLGECELSTSGAMAVLRAAVAGLPRLAHLSFKDNPLSKAGEAKLREAAAATGWEGVLVFNTEPDHEYTGSEDDDAGEEQQEQKENGEEEELESDADADDVERTVDAAANAISPANKGDSVGADAEVDAITVELAQQLEL